MLIPLNKWGQDSNFVGKNLTSLRNQLGVIVSTYVCLIYVYCPAFPGAFLGYVGA